ncbi:hypothetical protein JTE90_019958 [Oedothorax gibbosus]|uniref:Uncharacterized protein n=1 Tax=Oedothorax gibbosus TaxID=931172 RepID=A0AAV6UUT5_9ARAC|nr:hypothetical protein JTE90_019958 [Oedothorax gibbosus]
MKTQAVARDELLKDIVHAIQPTKSFVVSHTSENQKSRRVDSEQSLCRLPRVTQCFMSNNFFVLFSNTSTFTHSSHTKFPKRSSVMPKRNG